MPAVADETEQERLDRLAREQDAALAEIQRLQQIDVAQPQIQDAPPAPEIPFTPPESRLPQTAIPAENTSFTNDASGGIQIDTPEGYAPPFNREMVGDQQYQNEVARARAGSGFIQGYGDTKTYDPAIAEAAQQREQDRLAAQARRFAAVQGYQQAIRNGNTPAEALALYGKDMFGDNPQGLVNLVTRRETPPKVAPLQKFVPGKMTPAIRAESGDLEADLRRQENTLAKGTKPGVDRFGKKTDVPLAPEEVARLEANINRIKGERKQLLSSPEINPNVDQVGWQNMRTAWDAADIPRATVQAAPAKAETAAAPAKAQETVVVTKDGRRYFLPKSQLDEALKTGYQLGR